MKAVITGATGFVGTWLVRELLTQNDEVTVIVRDKKSIREEWAESVHVVEATLEQFSELDNIAFNEKKADIFYHFAWAGTAGNERADVGIQLKNVEATCEAVMLAKRLGCKRFVNAGSIMEYEAIQYVPSDGARPGMGNIYSTAKLTADFMAKTVATKENIEFINIIISNIYGAGERSARFLNTTLRKMLNDESIAMTHGNQLYDFIYVTDAVKAITLAAKQGESNAEYYIGNTKQQPLKEYILMMKSVLKSETEILFGKVPFTGIMLSYEEFDTGKLERMGFVPEVSFEEGIIRTRDWILEEENEC